MLDESGNPLCPNGDGDALDHARRCDEQAPLPIPPASHPWVDAGEFNPRRGDWVAVYRCRRTNLEASIPMVGKRKPRAVVVTAFERAVCRMCRADCGWREETMRQWDALGQLLPWMTVVPVPPLEVLPRGLYAEPVGLTPIGVSLEPPDPTSRAADRGEKEGDTMSEYSTGFLDYRLDPDDVAASGKEGAMEWTTEKLVEALKESAEWARARLDVAAIHRGIPDEQADHYIPGDVIRQNPDFLSHATQWSLHELAESIRSGAVYGSAERCCICGAPGATHWDRTYYYPHFTCNAVDNPACSEVWDAAYADSTSDSGAFETARTILRARRLLGERKGKAPYIEQAPPANPEPTREPWMGSPDHCAICGHGPASPTSPFDSFVCWGATGVRPESPTDMHVCERAWMDGCKAERSDDRRESERRVIERAHAWYVANAERERPYAAQAARESSAEFREWRSQKLGRAAGLTSAVTDKARDTIERIAADVEWRRRNLEGVRGPDPRIILAGDLLDPRGRAR